MLAQLVERALSMCKVRSSTLLHSTIFFCCCGVGGVLRGAKNNKQHRVFDSKEEDKYMMSSNAKEVREAFFFTYEFFFLREVSFLQLLQYYDELRIIIMYHTIRVYFHLLLLVLVLFTLYYMYYISLALYCSMFQLLKNAGTPNAKSVGFFST
jgi:hypothetical protein